VRRNRSAICPLPDLFFPLKYMKICGNAKMLYRRKKNLNTVKLTTLTQTTGQQEMLES